MTHRMLAVVSPIALLWGVLAAPAPAIAQQDPDPRGQVASIDDVVVTGRRRSERLEALPTSGDVITGDVLDDRGIDTGRDLSRLVPGVQVLDNGSGLNDEMVIRGEGSTRQNNIEPGAGLYRDGMFIAGGNVGGRNFVRMDFFDLEQVEVLRGPQGSYFGRNSLGGAINMVSASPGFGDAGRLRVDYGSQERYGAEGVVNFSLGEIDFRLGGLYGEQNDGFYRSSTTGRVLDYSSYGGLRLSAAARPSENWSLSGLIEYGEEDAPAQQVFEYTEAVDDPPFNTPGPSGYAVDRFDKPLDLDPRVTRDTFTAMTRSIFNLAGIEVISLTGYRERQATSITDADFNASTAVQRALTAVGDGEETFERFVQDTRVQSSGDGMQWMVGLEYSKVDSDFYNTLIPEVPATLPPGCAGGVCSLPLIQGTARAVYRTIDSTVDDTSWALYGALGWTLRDDWKLAVDFRYTEDQKNFFSLETRQLDNPATPANEQIQLLLDESRDFSVFTPGASLTWRTPNGGTIYGKVATGYRGGGFNNDPGEPNDGVSGIALQRSFEPEYVTSFELGAKGRLPGVGRYELNAYYNIKTDTFANYAIWVGCPAVAPAGCAPNSTRNVGTVTNVGDAFQYGVEAELQGSRANMPWGGRFFYSANLGWADGEYDDGAVWANSNSNPAATLATRDIGGRRLARLRELTGSITLGYDAPVRGSVRNFGSLSVRGELGGWEDPGNTIPYDDVLLVDANFGFHWEVWSATLIGKNIFDHSYYNIHPLNQTFGTQQNQPATWLVRLSRSF